VKIIIPFKLSVLLSRHNILSDGLANMGTFVVYVDRVITKINFA